MKKWFWVLLLLPVMNIHAQIKQAVNWQYHVNKVANDEYEAVLSAKIEKGWHLYSKDLPKDSGIPTSMKITSENAEVTGNVMEVGKKVETFSEAFGVQIVYYSDSVRFVQKFGLKDPNGNKKISSEITFQVCNDRICLAPNTLEFEQEIGSTTLPEKQLIENKAASNSSGNSLKVASLDFKKPLVNCGTEQVKEDSGNGLVFILGFLGGLIALLTPCVFPMIPLTVSFFIKGAANRAKGKRNAILYGVFILLIFVALSIPFYILDGISGNVFNNISTNIWLNLFFFAIFLFFALSFFGYYEITLPNWIANKSVKAEEAGGLVGIFFMALTLVIVSFSCTGPILGSLLGGVASSAKNVPVLLTFALAGFGLAWAIVFGLLALFPQALQSLPKSGGWMNTVKVVLGFIEVA